MKTLDQVIKNLEDGTEHLSAILISKDTWNDALHYLKEYKSAKDELDSTRLAYLDVLTDYVALKNYWAEQQANPALSWDELRTMKGKPVWVEGSHGPALSYKGWALISFDRQGDDMKCQLYNSSEFWIGEEDYGTDWQSYRKERK